MLLALVPVWKFVVPMFVMPVIQEVMALVTLSVLPAFTVTAPETAPVLAAVPICNVPPLIVVPPLYTLMPDSVSVPEPVLTSEPVPEMTPVTSVESPFEPTVNWLLPSI